jgi:hypothetical protein
MRTPMRLQQRRIHMRHRHDALTIPARLHHAGITQVAGEPQIPLHRPRDDLQRRLVERIRTQANRRQFSDDPSDQFRIAQRQQLLGVTDPAFDVLIAQQRAPSTTRERNSPTSCPSSAYCLIRAETSIATFGGFVAAKFLRKSKAINRLILTDPYAAAVSRARPLFAADRLGPGIPAGGVSSASTPTNDSLSRKYIYRILPKISAVIAFYLPPKN